MPLGSGPRSPSDEAPRRELDLRDIVDIWYRRRFMVVSLIVLTMISMEFWNWVAYPSYESTVKILIEGHFGFEVPFSRDKVVFKKSEITQTQSEMLISRPNLAEVVRALDLDKRPRYGTGLRDRIHAFKDDVIQFYRDTKQGLKEFVIVSVFGGRYTPPRSPSSFEAAIAHLQRSAVVEVEPIANTDMLVLSVRDRDAEYSSSIANKLAEVFASSELEAHRRRAREIRDSIGARLATVDPEMEDRRRAVAQFKDGHNIVDLEGQISTALEELSLLEMTYWDVSQKESVRELSTWEAIKRDTTANRDIAHRERAELIQKQSELAELLAVYGPDYPKVVAARAAVSEMQRHLVASKKLSSGDPPEVAIIPNTDTGALRGALLAKIRRIREDLAEFSRLDSQYQILLWDQEHTGEVLKFLTRKGEDATIAEHTTQSQVRIIESAQPQYRPIRPRKWLNRALALLSSIAVVVGLAGLLEYLDRTMRTPEAVARLAGLKTLGSIPFTPR